jgi:dolichyl-phosphate-mannose--protein O-mannosyl transferase
VSERSAIGRRDWSIALAITFLAFAVRAWDLNVPSTALLDEFWYARDGCFYWRGSQEACGMAGLVAPDRDVATWLARYGELTPEHPPLAKWLIGAPMALLHYGSGPARLSPLFAGALTVLLLYLLVQKAFGSRWIAAGASLGLAVDFPHFVHSRLAMLDVFTALFAVAAFLFLVLDREHGQRAAGGLRWWRIAAAVAAGCAAATKLSGAAVAAAILFLVWLWDWKERRRPPRSSKRPSTAMFALDALVLLAVATATYVLTYSGRLEGSLFTLPWADDAWLRAWWERQVEMVTLQSSKPTGISQLWDLPMTSPPLIYFLRETPEGVREVLLFGNPLMWWGGFAAAGVACFDWVTRRGRSLPCELVVMAFIAGMAGWLSLTVTGRTVHLYHAIPITPFLYLALAYLAARVWNRRSLRAVALTILLLGVGGFVYYLPILNAQPLNRRAWEPRGCSAIALWLSHIEQCGMTAATRSKSPPR